MRLDRFFTTRHYNRKVPFRIIDMDGTDPRTGKPFDEQAFQQRFNHEIQQGRIIGVDFRPQSNAT